jgi:hypothetical protein
VNKHLIVGKAKKLPSVNSWHEFGGQHTELKLWVVENRQVREHGRADGARSRLQDLRRRNKRGPGKSRAFLFVAGAGHPASTVILAESSDLLARRRDRPRDAGSQTSLSSVSAS